jgi:hypothetical protein
MYTGVHARQLHQELIERIAAQRCFNYSVLRCSYYAESAGRTASMLLCVYLLTLSTSCRTVQVDCWICSLLCITPTATLSNYQL